MAEITTLAQSQKTPARPTYRVKAIWKTLQGEGFFAGRPAVFVRLVGCNLWSGYEEDRHRDAERMAAQCPLWCDTDFTKAGSQTFNADELARALCQVGGPIRFCVLTGGEPLLQVDPPLLKALHAQGFQVAVETNGTVALQDACWDEAAQRLVAPDWIVCSPKKPQDQLKLEYFDELKLVLPDYHPDDYRDFARRQRPHDVLGFSVPLRWLQPEDGPRLEDAARLAIETALQHPEWRVSIQLHKILGLD